MGNGNGKNPTIFIANDTGRKIRVILSPNENFEFKQLFAKNDPILSKLEKESILSVGDLWAVWEKMDPEKHNEELIIMIRTLFVKFGIEILPQTACDIYDLSLDRPLDYLSAYGWGKMCVGKYAWVTIFVDEADDIKKLAQFQTIENWSWIAHENYVTRSTKESLWVDAIKSGYKMVTREVKKQQKQE